LAEPRDDFGPVSRLQADAVGKPGKRAFRLLIESQRGSACLWVEREQLQALAMLIEQLLSGWPAIEIRGAPASAKGKRPSRIEFSASPDVDFRVGQLALGFDEQSSVYILLAHNVESEAEEPDFACQATRGQLRGLSETITPLLAAGRPRCPMCEAPLSGEKHRCDRANGHIRGVQS
jgi:uncharacterized repeat protein (TIGR03847 family)